MTEIRRGLIVLLAICIYGYALPALAKSKPTVIYAKPTSISGIGTASWTNIQVKDPAGITLKGSLKIYTPASTGIPNQYRLSISFDPAIKTAFHKKWSALSGDGIFGEGLFLTSGKPGEIMLALEQDKAFIGVKQQLYFKEMKKDNNVPIPYLHKNKKSYSGVSKYGTEHKPSSIKTIHDHLFEALTIVGKTTWDYIIGLTPIGTAYGIAQGLFAFQGVKPNVVHATTFRSLKDAGKDPAKPLPVFSDEKHYDRNVMAWKKLKGITAGPGYEFNYVFSIHRKKTDEIILYVRAFLPYSYAKGLGYTNKLEKVQYETRYMELEWPLKIPAVEEIPDERTRYKLVPWWETWPNAKKDCSQRGGHLVTIESEDENNTIKNLLLQSGYPHAWIGLRDAGLDPEKKTLLPFWEWVTQPGKVATGYSNFGLGEPMRGGREYYVDIRDDGTWNDYCDDNSSNCKMPYICEFEDKPVQDQIQPTSIKTDTKPETSIKVTDCKTYAYDNLSRLSIKIDDYNAGKIQDNDFLGSKITAHNPGATYILFHCAVNNTGDEKVVFHAKTLLEKQAGSIQQCGIAHNITLAGKQKKNIIILCHPKYAPSYKAKMILFNNKSANLAEWRESGDKTFTVYPLGMHCSTGQIYEVDKDIELATIGVHNNSDKDIKAKILYKSIDPTGKEYPLKSGIWTMDSSGKNIIKQVDSAMIKSGSTLYTPVKFKLPGNATNGIYSIYGTASDCTDGCSTNTVGYCKESYAFCVCKHRGKIGDDEWQKSSQECDRLCNPHNY